MNNNTNYEKWVKVVAQDDITKLERGDQLIQSMCKAAEAIIAFRYTVEHYKGEQIEVLNDACNVVKNAMAYLVSNADIYMEQMQIVEDVLAKAEKRVEKIGKKVEKKWGKFVVHRQ